jgi:hypothetical protein
MTSQFANISKLMHGAVSAATKIGDDNIVRVARNDLDVLNKVLSLTKAQVQADKLALPEDSAEGIKCSYDTLIKELENVMRGGTGDQTDGGKQNDDTKKIDEQNEQKMKADSEAPEEKEQNTEDEQQKKREDAAPEEEEQKNAEDTKLSESEVQST